MAHVQAGDKIDLPAPTGPFAVGSFTHDWRDPTRPDDFIPEREHLAAAFTVWYPAEPTAAEGQRAAYVHDALIAALQADRDLAVWASRIAPVAQTFVSSWNSSLRGLYKCMEFF